MFGKKVEAINFQEYGPSMPLTSSMEGKCTKCESTKCRQDLPYFQNLENIETIVIAEAPGSGDEKGDIGCVFGWQEFQTTKSLKLISYRNFFFNVLGLNPETTYITDGVKCYTPKHGFGQAFSHCKDYLFREIEILKPKMVLAISRQGSLLNELRDNQNKLSYKLEEIPHPSNQNLSKIPTVGQIFQKLGEINGNQDWVQLGERISKEYEELRRQLGEG